MVLVFTNNIAKFTKWADMVDIRRFAKFLFGNTADLAFFAITFSGFFSLSKPRGAIVGRPTSTPRWTIFAGVVFGEPSAIAHMIAKVIGIALNLIAFSRQFFTAGSTGDRDRATFPPGIVFATGYAGFSPPFTLTFRGAKEVLEGIGMTGITLKRFTAVGALNVNKSFVHAIVFAGINLREKLTTACVVTSGSVLFQMIMAAFKWLTTNHTDGINNHKKISYRATVDAFA